MREFRESAFKSHRVEARAGSCIRSTRRREKTTRDARGAPDWYLLTQLANYAGHSRCRQAPGPVAALIVPEQMQDVVAGIDTIQPRQLRGNR